LITVIVLYVAAHFTEQNAVFHELRVVEVVHFVAVVDFSGVDRSFNAIFLDEI
jgi:hypothetical protein